jgi:hypothetical protein
MEQPAVRAQIGVDVRGVRGHRAGGEIDDAGAAVGQHHREPYCGNERTFAEPRTANVTISTYVSIPRPAVRPPVTPVSWRC